MHYNRVSSVRNAIIHPLYPGPGRAFDRNENNVVSAAPATCVCVCVCNIVLSSPNILGRCTGRATRLPLRAVGIHATLRITQSWTSKVLFGGAHKKEPPPHSERCSNLNALQRENCSLSKTLTSLLCLSIVVDIKSFLWAENAMKIIYTIKSDTLLTSCELSECGYFCWKEFINENGYVSGWEGCGCGFVLVFGSEFWNSQEGAMRMRSRRQVCYEWMKWKAIYRPERWTFHNVESILSILSIISHGCNN